MHAAIRALLEADRAEYQSRIGFGMSPEDFEARLREEGLVIVTLDEMQALRDAADRFVP